MKYVTIRFYTKESTKTISEVLEDFAKGDKLQSLIEKDSDIDWTIR